MTDPHLAGGCRCGAIRYEVTSSSPVDVTHCHCSMCRRSASTPYLTWMQLPAGTVTIDGALRDYASSDQGTRSFCPTCGCQILFRYQSDQDFVYLTAATLDDPEAVTPLSHSYVNDSIRWIHVDDVLPRYELEKAT
jgi:hypothetical protein